jgi:HEPN domain-containing protein
LHPWKTSLDHLPDAKRRELARIVEILFAEFEDALKGRNAPHHKAGADPQDHPLRQLRAGRLGRRSQGGLQVRLRPPSGREPRGARRRIGVLGCRRRHLLRAYQISHELTAPANFIVHSLSDVNKQLKRGRPFFVDIVRDGIALYEAPDHPFEQPHPLSAEEARKEAQGYFDDWFVGAVDFLEASEDQATKGKSRLSAFLLHQATERLYHCVQLVLTLYSPKSHKLNFLRSQAERLAPELIAAWPRESRFEQRCWELIRRAYVDARYSPHYKITSEELAWLVERAGALRLSVEVVCRARLDEAPN